MTADSTMSWSWVGKKVPRLTAPTRWPARPTLWTAEATDGGDWTRTTSSSAPISIPSSSEFVATMALRAPDLSRVSTSRRSSFESEPWWE